MAGSLPAGSKSTSCPAALKALPRLVTEEASSAVLGTVFASMEASSSPAGVVTKLPCSFILPADR